MNWPVGALLFALLVTLAMILTMTLPAGVAASDNQELTDDERYTLLTAPVEAGDDGDWATFDERAEITIRRFQSLWRDQDYGEGLADASDEEVSFRLSAAHTAAFHRRSQWVLERFDSVLEEAHGRGIAEDRYYRLLFDGYMARFQFAAAAELHQRYPDIELPEVPEVIAPPSDASADGLMIWQVLSDPPRMKHEVVGLEEARLYVVNSWGCGFCRHAARALADDEVLGPIMREHSIWVSAPSFNDTFRGVAWWNNEYPEFPTYLVDDPEQWPIADFASTPQFYFVADGQVHERLSGWRGGSKAMWALVNGLAGIGLIDPDLIAEEAFAYADQPSARNTCETRSPALEQIRAQAPITTRERLEAHLASAKETGDSPLFSLSEQARIRLINSMRFTENGNVAFRLDELRSQLEPEDIHALTSLFGQQYFLAGNLFPLKLLSEEERDLRDRVKCTGEYAEVTPATAQGAQD